MGTRIHLEIFCKLKEAQQNVVNLEQQLQMGWNDDVHAGWENSKKELLQLEKWESELLCNQTRLD